MYKITVDNSPSHLEKMLKRFAGVPLTPTSRFAKPSKTSRLTLALTAAGRCARVIRTGTVLPVATIGLSTVSMTTTRSCVSLQ